MNQNDRNIPFRTNFLLIISIQYFGYRSENGCEKEHIWFEISSGYGEPGCPSSPPKIPGSTPSSHPPFPCARVTSNRVPSSHFLREKALGTRLTSNKVGQSVGGLCLDKRKKRLKQIKYKLIRNP